MNKKLLLLLPILLWTSPLVAKDVKQSLPPKSLGLNVFQPAWGVSLKTKGGKGYLPEMASPYLEDNHLYIGTHGSYLYSINAQTGKVLWKFLADGPIASKPIASGTTVFFGDNKGKVYALDTSNGTKKWDLFVGGEILAEPALSGGSVFFVTTSREVYSLSQDTGEINWVSFVKGYEKDITMRGNADVVVSGDKLFLSFADGQVAAIGLKGGDILWNKNFGGGEADFWDIDSAILIDGGQLYVGGYFGSLVSLSASNGQLLWQADVKSGSNLAQDQNNIYVSSNEGQLISYNKKNGIKEWKTSFYSGVLSPVIKIEDYLVVGSEKNGIFVTDKTGKVLQRFKGDSSFLSEGVSENKNLYFLSTQGRLVAYRLNEIASPIKPSKKD